MAARSIVMEASLNDIMMVILMKRLWKRLSKSVLAGNYENTVGLRTLCAENIGDTTHPVMSESWIVRSSRMTRIHDGAHRNGPLRPGMRYFGMITISILAVLTLL
jgi:hypothetical protein